MSAFDDTLELAGEAMLACLDPETITYTPAVGAARSIEALIQREVPLELANHEIVPATVLRVRNHATLGILASAVDTGGDKITWQPKRGGATKDSRIVRIVAQDAGHLVLEVA